MKTKIHKLNLDDFFDDHFKLIAIYSKEEDYRMAFLLNYYFKMRFIRTKSIKLSNKVAEYSVFEFKDKSHYRDYYLLHNYFLSNKPQISSINLFSEVETIFEKPIYYLEELSKARYLLKIESDDSDEFFEDFVQNLASVPQIYTATSIDINKIKKKDLLNF